MDKSKADLKREYFAVRDSFYKVGTGFSRAEIHDLFKRSIFPLLADEEDNWEDDYDEDHILTAEVLSLNWLSKKGLVTFIEQCKAFVNDKFGIAL